MSSKTRPLAPLVALALTVALLACAAPSPLAPDLLVEPIQVDSVEVSVSASAPASVLAHVRGIVGDGCSTLHSVRQERSGNAVAITILRERPRDAICTQIARLYDESLPLQGPFAPGRYQLRVNAFELAFTVP